MEESMPAYANLNLSYHVEAATIDGETIIQEFIEYNRNLKKIKADAKNHLIPFMETNRDSIQRFINAYNRKNFNDYQFTFDKLVEIAVDWDPEDIDRVVGLAKVGNLKHFTNALFKY